MRLINTRTGLLEEFVGKAIPKYAVLSHTWSEDEVTFGDLPLSSCQSKKGYRKISMTCDLAFERGLQYAWVDTCCIDKSSSVEVSEAINAMYRWYERSQVCFAYLEDLSVSADLHVDLRRCRWFTRGWTLQELIAPYDVIFYDQDWNFRGSKEDLMDSLINITRIDGLVLQHRWFLPMVTAAKKFSWAAHRETSRVEDIAYCLLGLFNINMPLLYGEEERAFQRLQAEIINTAPDLSIFAWTLPNDPDARRPFSPRVYASVLAESPEVFAKCSSFYKSHLGPPLREFLVTNAGIKTKIQVVQEGIPGRQGLRYILPLDCCADSGKHLGIRLRKCGRDQFIREDPFNLVERQKFLGSNVPRERYLPTRLPAGHNAVYHVPLPGYRLYSNSSIAKCRSHALQIKFPKEIGFYEFWPIGRYDYEDQLFFVEGDTTWDSAMLRMNFAFELERRHDRPISVGFQCMVFALGWSETSNGALQCSIMESSPALSEVYNQLLGWDSDTSQIIHKLEHYKIPRSSSAIIRIPGTQYRTMVSFRAILLKDEEICLNKFWCIEFFCKVLDQDDVPLVSNVPWIQNS